MPSIGVIRALLRESVTSERSPRSAEPDLVMDDPDKVAAYNRAGREDGVMAPVYLYHAAQVSEVVKPGDSVIDLGCGPATQLGMVARFNPEVSFTGVDLSEEMLSRARDNVAEKQLGNVRFEHCDITSLDFLADNSVDAVMSTVVLHHLPDVQALEKVFAEVKRVLKPGGGLYLVDFGHLKSEKSIEYFAYQYADRQAELFTCDYLYSLRAAFQKDDFRWLRERYLQGVAEMYSTFVMPFMVAMKSASRGQVSDAALAEMRKFYESMPDYHKRDIADLMTFFRLGGLRSVALNRAIH